MTHDDLRALADALEPMAAAPVFERLDIPGAVAFLRQCAEQRPDAWMYEHDGCVDTPIITASRWAKCEEPWTETALYLHPVPQPQPVLSGYGNYGAAIPGIERPCTCHQDDNPPVPCTRQYALNECRAAVSEPTEAQIEPTIDLDALSWASIKQAASESKWMPPEYTANDWVSDVCAFLREREGEPTEAQIEAATDAWQAHCGLLLLSREDARDEVLIVLRAALAAKEE